MLNKFFSFLRQPYPYYFGGLSLLRLSGALFLLAMFFNYFFEPFNVNPKEHRMDYFWICVLHSVLPTLLILSYFTVLNKFGFGDEKWTVGKDILHLAIVLFLIGIQNFLIRDLIYDNPYNWSMRYFVEEMRNTFLAGSLLLAIIVPVNYSIQLNKHIKSAQKMSDHLAHGEPRVLGEVNIVAQVQADHFMLPIDRFLFAKADGNYVEVFLQQGKSIEKLLKRVPLKELERQLAHIPHFIKTHRSYLVNARQIISVDGNAQGYQLSLHGYDESVPVSRGMVEDFDRLMSA